MAGAPHRDRPDEIYRLEPDDAFRQGLWIVIGVGLFALTLLALRRDYRRARVATSTCSGSRRSLLLVLPGAARDRPDGQRRAPLGEGRPVPVPAGRAREDLADRLPRRLPAREARGARAGPAEGLRAAAPDLGRRDARARPDERPRQRAPLLRDLPRDALRRDRARRVRRWPASRSSSAAPRSSTSSSAHVHERVTIWLHPWTDEPVFCASDRRARAPPGLRLSSSSSASTRSRTAASAAPGSARARSRRPTATRSSRT